jgi:hypothetical protein
MAHPRKPGLTGATPASGPQRASFIHHAMLREQVVRPRLAEVFPAAGARGVDLDLTAVLDDAGL